LTEEYATEIPLPQFALWDRLIERRVPLSFTLEVTARCNNNCRHCYLNLPAGDRRAAGKELTCGEIGAIADQAVNLGSLWCLITGGEPLLRDDFFDIYRTLKSKGLLVSVFTNACLITDDHINLFRQYPPRNIEVTVYGVTKETYEKVSRRPGSYAAFKRGLHLLISSGIKVTLKAMALRSNMHELPDIARFCRLHTTDYFRFDPLLHLRYDRNKQRNAEIMAERLSPAEIVALEQADPDRAGALLKGCGDLIVPDSKHSNSDHLFHCGTGNNSFDVKYDGNFRLCSSLSHPDCIYDLRKGTLAEAWNIFTPSVRNMRSADREFLEKCRKCPIINLCLWCPAHAYLESGNMDAWCSYFCEVAHARADAIEKRVRTSRS
jgi:radical SAM protein with 4Fe4S-binding SPASM domain